MLLFLYYSRYYNFMPMITDYIHVQWHYITDYIRSQWYAMSWVAVCASMMMPDEVFSELIFVILNIMFNVHNMMLVIATGTCWSHVMSKEGTDPWSGATAALLDYWVQLRNCYIWFRLICAIIRQFKAYWIASNSNHFKHTASPSTTVASLASEAEQHCVHNLLFQK